MRGERSAAVIVLQLPRIGRASAVRLQRMGIGVKPTECGASEQLSERPDVLAVRRPDGARQLHCELPSVAAC